MRKMMLTHTSCASQEKDYVFVPLDVRGVFVHNRAAYKVPSIGGTGDSGAGAGAPAPFFRVSTNGAQDKAGIASSIELGGHGVVEQP